MKATTAKLQVLSVESREVPSRNPNEGSTTFLTFQCFDGTSNHKLWAFSDDFPMLPQVNEAGVFEIAVHAKAGQYGAYLSVRALSFIPVSSE